MKKIKRRQFRVPIYECFVKLVVTEDVPAEYIKHPDQFKGVRADDSHCQAFYVSCWPNFTIVIKPTSPLSDIAHEIGHVSRAIMNAVGFTITSDNDEPLAYLEDFLHKKINVIIKKL